MYIYIEIFKLACLTYQALSTSKPPYLQSLLTPYIPPCCLQSSSTGLLAEPGAEQLWAGKHSMPLPPGNGINFCSFFVAQIHLLLSKSGSKLTILVGFQAHGYLARYLLVADYPRVRFTFRCDLARVKNTVINLLITCPCH